ncbi:DoxX family protein [Massilia sp. W12]|uniref:DoxX family protein n=1 Tax=Massilia sp. W12 TaxID=3126507 RepID=UPI0030CF8203
MSISQGLADLAQARFMHYFSQPFECLIRLYLAKTFFWAGLSKVDDWSATLALFSDEYHVPLLSPSLAAWSASAAELLLPVLLAAGCLKRLAALALFMVNGVAVLAYYHVLRDMPAALQDHVEWGLMLLALAAWPGPHWNVAQWIGPRQQVA